VALLYALVNFVGTIAVMRFFEYRNVSGERDGPGTEA
jgi:multisubunit Na+/H+ antiporter MnhF subunit